MMKTQLLRLMSAALIAMVAGFLNADDLLTNGSFCTGNLQGWTDPSAGGGNAFVGAPGVGGEGGSSNALLLVLEAGVSQVSQTFPASPGDEFKFSGFTLTENALPAGDTFGLFKIVFRDSDGNDLEPTSSTKGVIVTGAFPGIESLPRLDSSSAVNAWTLSEAEGVAPAGTVEVLFLVLNVDFAGGANPMWFDSITACNTSDNIELLTNGDLETGDLTGWTDPTASNGSATVGAPAARAQGGAFAVEIALGGATGELRQSFPAAPGDEFKMSGYLLTENVLPGGPTFGLYKIVFRDVDGNDLVPASASKGQINLDFPGVESLPFLNFSSATDTWILSEAEGVAPADTVEVVFLVLNVDFAGGTNPMWFDSIVACNTADNIDLLNNGDFETGDTTGWVDPTVSVGNASVGEPAAGAQDNDGHAVQLASENSVSQVNQTFAASPGEEFSLSGYMLTENALPASGSNGLFKIVFRDAGGNDLVPASSTVGQIVTGDFPGIESRPVIDGTSSTNTWIFSEAQGVAPAGTVEVQFLALNVDFGGGTNPIWFDNISACLVPGAIVVTPDTVTRTRGDFVAGGTTELADSDNQDYQMRRSLSDLQSRTEFIVKGTSSIQLPTSFEFTLEGSVFARSNVVQSIEFFDYDASAWVVIDSRNAVRSPMPDLTVTVPGSGDLSRFVDDATGCIEARVRYLSDNPRQRFASNTDMTRWTIE